MQDYGQMLLLQIRTTLINMIPGVVLLGTIPWMVLMFPETTLNLIET